jgi:hypothetical protein
MYFTLNIAICNNLHMEDWQKRVCEILKEKGITQDQLADKNTIIRIAEPQPAPYSKQGSVKKAKT